MKKIFALMLLTFVVFNIMLPSVSDSKSKEKTKKNKAVTTEPVISDVPKVEIKNQKPKGWQPEIKVGILSKDSKVVVKTIKIEEYLRGVLPKEMSPSFNEEALKAQAVAARTFALKNRKRHQAEGYDLCNTTHCQVYNGLSDAHERTDRAIDDTFGEVLFYNEKLIEASFHTDSGGMTENSVDVWGTDFPYLRASTEIKTKTMPWTVKISLKDFSKKLADNKKNVGNVKLVKVTNLEIGKLTNDRSTSGRVKELTVVGSAAQIKLTGNEMRSLFALKSTMFDVAINGDEIVISGYGWGHGIGLSQYGAQAFAEKGYTYSDILAHYYKGTTLKRLY
ncbi:MAG: stage II sporulation protein D [Selenomonadaceae bacterium]|nr:stage II sporulation protein D [Selenomonadaceae bacterium]